MNLLAPLLRGTALALSVALTVTLPRQARGEVAPEDATQATRTSDATHLSDAPVLKSFPQYRVYRGNTHAHTSYTVSHGEQVTSKDPSRNGPPSEHHARAHAAGYDFYATTDHSQEKTLDPTSETNPTWIDIKAAAAQATDANYVALAGYEHSENNGGEHPGKGHINVISSNSYLDALEPGIDLPYFYQWLAKVEANDSGLPIVASFNHPGPKSYNSFDYRTPEATNIITLLEVINSNNKIHEEAYLAANNAGWKVSPTAGNDNHGFTGITRHTARVGVLATARTKAAILDALKNRRTFAALDKNMTLVYDANGAVMGSTLASADTVSFNIIANDPDIGTPENQITLLEVIDPTGAVVASETCASYSVTWTPTVQVAGKKFFYVRAQNAGSGGKPMAWAAPVWIGL